MDGIYAMYFTGSSGSGLALFVAKDGQISGADATGGILDGTFKASDDCEIQLDVDLLIPAGGMLVTGFANGGGPVTHRITASLPEHFGNGQPVAVSTPTGPVNVIFRKLRDM